MRVLIACAYSGITRDAFIAKGHDAMSCDFLPCERPGPHYQGDVRDILGGGWDLMIAHPTCTYLTNSGVRWLYNKDGTRYEPRWDLMRAGAAFFKELGDAPIPKKCRENPIMHKYAKEIIGKQQSQIIQPWMFGHGECKATCYWLDNLSLLKPTNIVEGREQRVHKMPPGPNRWRERSRCFQGVANAMADQWG